MSNEMDYNPEIFTLVDEEGVEQAFELLDVLEIDDERYFALMPYYENPEDLLDDDAELIVLKSDGSEEEEMMISIDDDEEYERIGRMFLERLADLFENTEE